MEKKLIINSNWNQEEAAFVRKNLIEYNMKNVTENDKEFTGKR
jgi:hypothetical protein